MTAAGDAARLVSLDVRDFRNLARVELAPPAAGVVIIGDNGQGKTSLLESISYLEILRSSRGVRDRDLVRFGADAFHIAARIDTNDVHDVGIGFERSTGRKRVRIDGDIPERLSEALGALPSVTVSPADVELIAGPPSARRRYLDILLALTGRGYLAALQRYRAALARRNGAMRDAARRGSSRDQLDAIAVWEPPLAQFGAVLWSERRRWVDSVDARMEAVCHEIGETAAVRVRYASTLPATDDPRSALAAALEDKRASDVRRGLTHVGPHRDDLAITLDGRDLRTFGSAGQQRTAAIALRMLEASTLAERLGRAPVLLLDDPFAELDERRAANILSLLMHAHTGQRILAVPRDRDIPRELTALDRLRITAGAISVC